MIRTLILIGAVALFIWNPYPLQYLELKGYDTLIMSTETIQNENILIVDLDEDLVKAYEGYPLPRSLYAELITKTNAVPGITVLMPDPDIRGKENDLLLSNTMRKVPTVLASAASAQTSEQGLHVGTAQLGEDPLPWLYQYQGILRTESILELNRKGLGLVTATPEIDGVTRRIPLVVNVQSKLYPAFGLELLRLAVNDPSYQLKTTQEGIDCAEAADANTVGILRIALLNKVSFSLPRISASGIKTVIPGTAFVFCISSAYKLLGSGYPS